MSDDRQLDEWVAAQAPPDLDEDQAAVVGHILSGSVPALPPVGAEPEAPDAA